MLEVLKELRELSGEATPGPWYLGDNYLIGGKWVVSNEKDPERNVLLDMIIKDEDGALTVAMRNRIDALIDAAEALVYVVRWTRHGEGDEATAAEMADAALACLEGVSENGKV